MTSTDVRTFFHSVSCSTSSPRDTESGAVVVAAPPPARRLPSLALAIAALVLVAVAAAMGFVWFSGDSEQIDSLAVLPFENGKRG